MLCRYCFLRDGEHNPKCSLHPDQLSKRQELGNLTYTSMRRHFRNYYNEVCYIEEMEQAEDISESEAEALLIDLDDKYTKLALDTCGFKAE